MQQALARLSKSLANYSNGEISRTLAVIELVSAFKVVCKQADVDPTALQASVEAYVNSVLDRLDAHALSSEAAIEDLCRVYEAASSNDPSIVSHMAVYI